MPIDYKCRARVEPTGNGWRVWVVWDSPITDRPETLGWACNDAALVDRLVACINAGAATKRPRLARDLNNKIFVQADATVLGRYLDRDLKALGF